MTFVSPPCTNVSKVHPRGGAAISVSYVLAFNAVSLTNIPVLFWLLLAPEGHWQPGNLGPPSPGQSPALFTLSLALLIWACFSETSNLCSCSLFDTFFQFLKQPVQ